MAKRRLWRVVGRDDKPVGWAHECPGCGTSHLIWVEQPNEESGARWTFDGNEDAPTFSPSVLCYHWSKYGEDGKKAPGAVRVTDCHYHLRAGVIEYCGDCAHALAGKSIPLPEIER